MRAQMNPAHRARRAPSAPPPGTTGWHRLPEAERIRLAELHPAQYRPPPRGHRPPRGELRPPPGRPPRGHPAPAAAVEVAAAAPAPAVVGAEAPAAAALAAAVGAPFPRPMDNMLELIDELDRGRPERGPPAVRFGPPQRRGGRPPRGEAPRHGGGGGPPPGRPPLGRPPPGRPPRAQPRALRAEAARPAPAAAVEAAAPAAPAPAPAPAPAQDNWFLRAVEELLVGGRAIDAEARAEEGRRNARRRAHRAAQAAVHLEAGARARLALHERRVANLRARRDAVPRLPLILEIVLPHRWICVWFDELDDSSRCRWIGILFLAMLLALFLSLAMGGYAYSQYVCDGDC